MRLSEIADEELENSFRATRELRQPSTRRKLAGRPLPGEPSDTHGVEPLLTLDLLELALGQQPRVRPVLPAGHGRPSILPLQLCS